MDPATAILIVIGVAIMACLIWIGLRLQANQTDQSLPAAVELLKAELISQQAESLLTLRQSIDTANKIVNDRLAEGTSSLDRRMAVLADIQTQLGELREQTDHIEAVGKNIQSLSDLLRPPKLRGGIGELFLENILGEILPKSAFEMQYRFGAGQRVDAIVKLSDRLLPIDAKFPLEDYERLQKEPDDPTLQKRFSQSFRKHIDAIADRYIRPDEKTTDFAVMYVPAEAVYYQLISQSNQDGFQYALSRRVIPSSPGHLYAFLASVATLQAELALAGGEAGQNNRRVRAGLDQLYEMTEKLAKYHTQMESSLRALNGKFDHARGELDSIRLQLEKLRGPLQMPDQSDA
jgi:DNA recombination protein RmuC